MVLVEMSAERHLVVLDDEYGRQPLRCGQIESFVYLTRLRRAIADPGHGNAWYAKLLERERVPGDHGRQTTHHADGKDDPVLASADVKVAPGAG